MSNLLECPGDTIPTVFVITRLRAPEGREAEIRQGLREALTIFASKPGYLGGDVGRNVDEPDLWAISTRWQNIGSYRRALGSYEAKMHIQPLMMHALDEPSAYEADEPGAEMNIASTRSLG